VIDLSHSSCPKEEYIENRDDRVRSDKLAEDTMYTAMIAFQGPGPEAVRVPARVETIERSVGSRSLWLALFDEDLNLITQATGEATDSGLWLPTILIYQSPHEIAESYEGYLLEEGDDIDMELLMLSVDSMKRLQLV
jgi:hypothetical protein